MKVSLAYSPDTDDQFMVLALREKRIPWGDFEFEFVVGDIQELNAAARSAKYDITAISVGAYPTLKNDYLLMDIGASVGERFGPAVVVKPGSGVTSVYQLQNRPVAVPGLNTSAYIAAQTLFGPFTPVPMYFMDISTAVLKGTVAAGILIHELQMNPESQGLQKLTDLGELWYEKYRLPLPLGANVIRRSLGPEVIQKLTDLYKTSIEFALRDRHQSIQGAVKLAAASASLNPELGDQYISRYVNERSLKFHSDTVEGISTLFTEGAALGLIEPIKLTEHLAR